MDGFIEMLNLPLDSLIQYYPISYDKQIHVNVMCVFFPAKADARTVNNIDVWFRPSAGGDQVVDIDTSFSDLLDNLDYGVSDIFIALLRARGRLASI